MELRVLVCTDEELKNITDQILEGCRSVDKEIVTSAAEAILVLLLADIEKTWMNKICDSLLELCFYRKEPGLHAPYFAFLHINTADTPDVHRAFWS